jgi:hypothetical protein
MKRRAPSLIFKMRNKEENAPPKPVPERTSYDY